MQSQTVKMEQWGAAEGYAVRVQAIEDAQIHDTGLLRPKHVRSVRVLATYENRSAEALKFSLGQWTLFDTEGFAYEFELRNQFYAEDALRKLRTGVIAPGQKAKGWVAFQLPPDAEPSHVQFRPNHLAEAAVNVLLHK